jgi:hypothetical protein
MREYQKRREFEEYLEEIYFNLEGFLPNNPRYKNYTLVTRKNQHGNWSSISLECEVINESGEFIGPYDCGIDINSGDIENHYDNYLKLKRDKIINKILR